MHILLVEDHEETARALGRLFRYAGVTMTRVATIAEARQVCRPGLFDLLLCDLSLPDGDGCELMREIKPRLGVPGVALTAHAYAEDHDRALASGFDVHLPKPVSKEDLWSAIEVALHARALCRPQ